MQLLFLQINIELESSLVHSEVNKINQDMKIFKIDKKHKIFTFPKLSPNSPNS